MAAPTKVTHVGKQPTSLDSVLGLVTWIFRSIQILPASCNFKIDTYSVLWSYMTEVNPAGSHDEDWVTWVQLQLR